MHFEIFPVAYATLNTFMNSVDKVIINPIILFLFACALVYFIYGVVVFLLNKDNEEHRTAGKSHMLWGIVGLFIMIAVFGIERIILNTVGNNKIQIENSGQINITP